ncbi:MAG: SLC13 family permease [Rhodospirillales bacterium]|nr:SLC13 family permease [Rhodospirillales bacterium]
MNQEQVAVFSILIGIFVLFAWGRIRYDVVAFLGLILCVLIGLVPGQDAFSGFSHPATITVAVVLILSRGLANSGVVDLIVNHLMFTVKRVSLQVAMLSGISAVFSTMINNVGALALLMPVGMESSAKAKRSPAVILMPMSFASILGGLVTLIGTPPNIIIANFRTNVKGEPFAMFDFSPVGGVVAVAGVAFIALVGWRMIPKKRQTRATGDELIAIDDYITEIVVPKNSELIGVPIRELDQRAEKLDVEIVGIIRGKRRILAALRHEEINSGDILIVKAGPQELDKFVTDAKLELGVGSEKTSLLRSKDTTMMEAVVQSRSRMEGRTFTSLQLKKRYGIHLLGVSRQGTPIRKRLPHVRFRGGDVVLLQGDSESLAELVSSLGCLPLAKRRLNFGSGKKAGLAVVVFATAIIVAAMDLASLQIALSAAAIAMVIFEIVPVRDVYQEIDWPVVILLGAMIPVGGALESTGGTQLIVESILGLGASLAPPLILAIVLVVTMTLSDVMNNAATAIVMAPVAVSIAGQLGVNADPFLMAVAVGASCAFLTPIGHQNNTLIMGPAGYQFSDYWRMGLPLEILIIALSVPMILFVWPL